jgi:hypothetical protein
LARSRPGGPAAATTARANAAACGDIEAGRQDAMQPAACGPGSAAACRLFIL